MSQKRIDHRVTSNVAGSRSEDRIFPKHAWYIGSRTDYRGGKTVRSAVKVELKNFRHLANGPSTGGHRATL